MGRNAAAALTNRCEARAHYTTQLALRYILGSCTNLSIVPLTCLPVEAGSTTLYDMLYQSTCHTRVDLRETVSFYTWSGGVITIIPVCIMTGFSKDRLSVVLKSSCLHVFMYDSNYSI